MISPSEEICRLRRQLMVHSLLYYKLDRTIWDDQMFDRQGYRLVELQKQYGTQHGYKDDLFADWDGSTGFHLVRECGESEWKAAQLIWRVHNEREGVEVV